MTKIVVVDRSGELKTVKVKDITAENIYKKAGLKSGENFALQHSWGQEDGLDQRIELYAKSTGKAGQENKYDFPPPVDEKLFFGPCVLLGKDANGNFVDLDEAEWEEIYEFLFGGFEDIGSEDSDDAEDDIDTDDEVEALTKSTGTIIERTKQGYAKDGFIVDDDEDYEDEDAESDESSVKPSPSKKKSAKALAEPLAKALAEPLAKALAEPLAKDLADTKKTSSDKKKLKQVVLKEPIVEQVLDVEDCESELSEESYV
jgi:hypothetical protein